jgi:hypothetical protein
MNFVAYFCFVLAVLSLVAIFAAQGNVEVSLIYVVLAGIWYQTGAGFMKRKLWAWWSSLILLSMFCFGSALSVWSSIVQPLITPGVVGVGYGRGVSLVLLIFTGYLASVLVKPATREAFKNA